MRYLKISGGRPDVFNLLFQRRPALAFDPHPASPPLGAEVEVVPVRLFRLERDYGHSGKWWGRAGVVTNPVTGETLIVADFDVSEGEVEDVCACILRAQAAANQERAS